MVSSVVLLVSASIAWAVYAYISGLRSNVAKAQRTNLPYMVVPVHPFNRLWQLTAGFWVPLIKRLPKSWWESWLWVLLHGWAYRDGQEPWNRMGDTFIICAPGDNTLYTRNAEAIHQMAVRRELFPKDVRDYGVLKMFGENVLVAEGALWRMHRKVTSSSFNERNAAHTFAEAISQTRGLVSKWLGPDGKGHKTITTIERDIMTLALNIIAYVGFGLRLLWPGQTLPADIDPKLAKFGSLEPPPGHTMSFSKAIAETLDRIFALMFIPGPILERLPMEWAKRAYEAKVNYTAYMEEFLQDKIAEVRSGEQAKDSMDIMGQLVRAKYDKYDKHGDGGSELQDSDIIGNAFIMLVAGHETTTMMLQYTCLQLAMNPAAQRAVQEDVDKICGTSDPSTWNYEAMINHMFGSHLGAAMNETLRLMPAVLEVPKIVSPSHGSSQVITIDGQKHVLPAGLTILFSLVAVHRNPRYWPGAEYDLDDYDPERWYRSSQSGKEEADEKVDAEDYGGFQGSDTSASLFRPVQGAFVAFSDGARSCLGRRIAQVEMLAALAVIYQNYSIELAVDEWATDDEVDRLGPEEKRKLYKKAQEKSRATLLTATSVLTLRLPHGSVVPIRLVRRGEERFVNLVDANGHC